MLKKNSHHLAMKFWAIRLAINNVSETGPSRFVLTYGSDGIWIRRHFVGLYAISVFFMPGLASQNLMMSNFSWKLVCFHFHFPFATTCKLGHDRDAMSVA